MSVAKITCERVNEVEHHPNADRLDVVQVLGYKVVTGRDQFKVGDSAIYFPPDILIPEEVSDKLGVRKYLKHAIYPNDLEKTQCRVSSCRLRGVPSHGFIHGPVEGSFGADVTHMYKGQKYVPPTRTGAGDALPELANFHAYTSIENVQRYPDAIPEGTMCRFTEKIHGTNCRLGLVRDETGEWTFAAGSHRVRRAEFKGESDTRSLYWEPMNENMLSMLTHLCDEKHDVVAFGEIFGPGIQDMDYGHRVHGFRVFDITVDGVYLDWVEVVQVTDAFNIDTVPLLGIREFSLETIEALTYGETTLADAEQIRCKFKGREGVVATPTHEQFSNVLGGRMIVKSVSADYRDRKGAQDNE